MSFKDREHTRNIENTDTVKKLRDINQRDMQENTGMWERDNESNKETYDRENMNGRNERPNYEEGRKTTKEKNKTGHIFLNLYAVLATIVAVVGIALCVRLYSENDSVGSDNQSTFSEIGATKGVGGSGGISENEYSVEEMKEIIRDYMENNKGTLEMLRELFPEDIVVYHTNRYMFIPVIEDLEKNDIDNEKIEKLDDGEIVYVENGEIVSHKGIDISKYQGDIDWVAVHEKECAKYEPMTIAGTEFIRRFLMHVLPKGFVRIRYYGLLACRCKKDKMTLCRNLLGCEQYISRLRGKKVEEKMMILYNVDICKCKECGEPLRRFRVDGRYMLC